MTLELRTLHSPSTIPDHGLPDPINPTRPTQKKPDPTRLDRATGRTQAEIFTRIQKITRPNPTQPENYN
jgi:hypothetical protein